MKSISVTYMGLDDWGRKCYKNKESGRIYKDTGQGQLYTSTSYGEPDCPLRPDLIINYE